MSCSLMTAASAVSKPASRPSTASATCGFGSASASGQDADRSTGWQARGRPARGSCARARLRSTARSTTRLPAACSAWTCLVTASNTLAFVLGALGREVAALRARRRRPSRRPPPAPRTASAAPAPRSSSRSVHSAFGQIEPVRRQRLVERAAVARRAPPCAPRSSPRSARAARAPHPRRAASSTTGAPGT